MNTECFDHRLTEQERRQFEDQGYFILPGAVDAMHIEELVAATDALYAAFGPASHRAAVRGRLTKDGPALNLLDAIGHDERFLQLLDWPKTIAKVVDILGWNISLYHSHLTVTPCRPVDQLPASPRLGWHQDTDRINRELETTPQPRVSLKIAFFFSNVSSADRGAFHVIPGSHLMNELDLPADEDAEHPQAAPVLVEAGDAVFFDRRLWHAAGVNTSEVTRKVLFVGYAYRWLRPRDEMTVDRYLEGADPIRRQLLGASPSGNYGYTSPADEDVPLRQWWAKRTSG